jgi:hypothetical protein
MFMYTNSFGHFCFVVDEKNEEAATFWSCLQDIQEGLQVIEHCSDLFIFSICVNMIIDS